MTTAKWTKMWDKPDVTDGSLPHGDCRNYAWDADTKNDPRLVLVSDGGVFAREVSFCGESRVVKPKCLRLQVLGLCVMHCVT